LDHSRSPKTARIACPWLLHRFIDHEAEIEFVPPDDVLARASKDPGVRDRAGHDNRFDDDRRCNPINPGPCRRPVVHRSIRR
jgi:hypothetical protein